MHIKSPQGNTDNKHSLLKSRYVAQQLKNWAGFSVPFRCLLYNQKCWVALEMQVYQLIYCCYCVTA